MEYVEGVCRAVSDPPEGGKGVGKPARPQGFNAWVDATMGGEEAQKRI